MGWPYQFVDLTDAQKHQRRTLLDTYGLIAQASAGVILLAIQLVFLVQWISQKRNERNGTDVPSSPHVKHSHKNQSGQRSIGYWWRRFSWWAGEPCTIFNNHLGTQGQVTAATLWTSWLLGLCFAETGKGAYHYCWQRSSSSLHNLSQIISISRNDSASSALRSYPFITCWSGSLRGRQFKPSLEHHTKPSMLITSC